MRILLLSLMTASLAGPAFATDTDGDSYAGASRESGEAVAALTEAGVKTVAGIVTIPLAVGGLGSQAVGSVANGVGDSAGAVGTGVLDGAQDAADFATSPLTVTDKVITRAPPAPAVPYDAQTAPAKAR